MWFETAYTFLGGLGIFFFGMKTLSESLQALSGDVIRRAIRTLTSNRLMGVAVGTFVTMARRSSRSGAPRASSRRRGTSPPSPSRRSSPAWAWGPG